MTRQEHQDARRLVSRVSSTESDRRSEHRGGRLVTEAMKVKVMGGAKRVVGQVKHAHTRIPPVPVRGQPCPATVSMQQAPYTSTTR